MSTRTDPLQLISGKDHDRCLRRSQSTVTTGGRTITSLCFASDIDGLACDGEEDLAILVECLYSMKISAKKTKLMTKNSSGINKEINVNRQKFETLTCFKYLV